MAIYAKFGLACVHVRPLNYLYTQVLHRAHAPCMCVHIAYARHDVTRFTYNANHIIVTSAAFAFHSCHVGKRWHASLVFALPEHHVIMVRMTSSCSHCIGITCMMSSHLHRDIIVITCKSWLQSWCMTDRPFKHDRQTFVHDIQTIAHDRQTCT